MSFEKKPEQPLLDLKLSGTLLSRSWLALQASMTAHHVSHLLLSYTREQAATVST
jgi:hypothetical protein